MDQTNETTHFNQHIGICVKTSDGFILERNDIITKACGQFCNQLCIDQVKKSKGEKYKDKLAGFNTFSKVTTQENKTADVMITAVGDKVITFLYPLDEQLEKNIKKYDDYKLTPSEKKVMSYIIKGLSNQDIADKLFISKATLKKHINNIYKKVPADSRPRHL